jgi:hypothetical protein
MENALFVGDLQKEIGNISEVNTMNNKYESYKIEFVKGEKFIIGEGAPGFYKGEKDIKMDDINLLLSVINLVKGGLPPKYYAAPPEVNELASVISDDNVLKWVEMYGIPYEDEKIKEVLNDELWKLRYLHLDSFRRKVVMLFACFSIWHAIVEDRTYDIEKYSNSLLTLPLNTNKKATDYLIQLKQALAKQVGSWANIQTGLKYDPKTGQNTFTMSSDSLIKLAYYQFATLMTKPPTENRKKLKTCDYCKSLYWTDYAKKKYCGNPCNRKTIWSRRQKE